MFALRGANQEKFCGRGTKNDPFALSGLGRWRHCIAFALLHNPEKALSYSDREGECPELAAGIATGTASKGFVFAQGRAVTKCHQGLVCPQSDVCHSSRGSSPIRELNPSRAKGPSSHRGSHPLIQQNVAASTGRKALTQLS